MKPVARSSISGLILLITLLFSACSANISTAVVDHTPPAANTLTSADPPSTKTPPSPTATATQLPTDTPLPTPTSSETPGGQAACVEDIFLPQGFVPDSLHLLALKDSSVKVIDLGSGELVSTLEAPMMIYRAALSPDGNTLAWALEDNSIQLLSYPQGELLHAWSAHTQRMDSLKFSPDGQLLYSASYDNWVRVWDMQGELVDEFAPGGMEVHAIGISPDGKLAATVSFEGPQKLWDLDTWTLVAELSTNGAFSPAEVVFSADGEMVGIALGGGPVSLWSVPEGEQLWSGGNFSLALSPDGRYLAYSDVNEDGSNKVMLASQDGGEVIHTLEAEGVMAFRLIFSPDSSLLVEVSEATRVWDVETGELRNVFKESCP